MRKNIKIIAIIAVILVVIMIAAAAAMSGGTKNNANNGNNQNTTPVDNTPVDTTLTDTTPVDTSPADIVLSGTGDSVSQSFTLTEGNAIFVMTHGGSSNFAIWLDNETGAMKDLLVNEIGTYSGSSLVGVSDSIISAKPGTYYLDISADGAWSVTVQQPRTTSAPSLPQTFTGTSDNVKAIYLTSGAIKFDMNYTGTGNFAVWVFNAAGNAEGLLANDAYTYSGAKTISVTTPGVHYLEVTGIGSWSIAVTHM